MKKTVVIALIVAVLLMVAGAVLVTMGLSYGADAPESTMETNIIGITEPFDSVVIDTQHCNVKLMPYNGDVEGQVTFLEQEAVSHSVAVVDGVLQIQMIDERKWTDYVGIFHIFDKLEEMEMTVYLPQTQYTVLTVHTDTGDIEVPQAFTFTQAQCSTDTGDLEFAAMVKDKLIAETATGDIDIRGGERTKIAQEEDTSEIVVEGMAGELHLKTDTGCIELENVVCTVLNCNTATGDVELEWVLAEEYLQVFTSTGDIRIENADAWNINIESDTGDVSGHFLTAKQFLAYSNTGKVQVPNGPSDSICRVETDTGDIRFH